MPEKTSLTPEERVERAVLANEKRWGTKTIVATHIGELTLGDVVVNCAVLEDGTRLINEVSLLGALGRPNQGSGKDDDNIPVVLSANNFQQYLTGSINPYLKRLEYRVPGTSARSKGYKAEILPEICEVILQARDDRVLAPSQNQMALRAEILMRSLAKVGITALVDEATGYQQTRARNELQALLEKYVAEEFRPWQRAFPDIFYKEIYRLYGWPYVPGQVKRNPECGKFTNRYVYDHISEGVRSELDKKNPVVDGFWGPYRKHKHHQFLTEETGLPHLDNQLRVVIALMKASDNKEQFDVLFRKVFKDK